MIKYWAHAQLDALPHCCGVVEAGEFQIESIDIQDRERTRWWTAYPHDSDLYDTEKEAWQSCLDGLLEEADGEGEFGCPIQFWFVKLRKSDEFENDGLRQLVLAHKDQIYLGTFVNPNSGNIIEGYMLKHNVKEIKE